MPTPPRRRPRRLWPLTLVVFVLAGTVLVGPASAANLDTDGDGLPDWYERDKTRTSPTLVDSDGDGIRDEVEDLDGDQLRNLWEQRSSTHPRIADTDGDGVRDDREDADLDRLLNVEEQARNTDPKLVDTDGDGFRDANEVRAGTDPRSAASKPAAAGVPPWVPGAEPCPIFPASNVWNKRIDTLPLDAKSATYISSIGLDRGLHMDFGSYAGYGIPYQVVTSSTTRSTGADSDSSVCAPTGTSPLIRSAARSAITITGALVLPRGSVGITDASTTRRPSTPSTFSSGVDHRVGRRPMRQVPTGW